MHSTDMTHRLAEIYAQPLFDLAAEQQQVKAVEEDLDLVMRLLDEEPLLGRFLASPAIVLSAKLGLLNQVLSGHVEALTLRFLQVTLQHDRAGVWGEIVTRFRELCNAHLGRHRVTMTVAAPVSRQQQQQLTAELTDALGGQVQLELKLDPSILGGTVIRYDGKRVDNSVQGRLQRIARSIAQAGKGTIRTDEI